MESRLGFGAGPFPVEALSLMITVTSPTVERSEGRALCLQGGRAAKALNSTGTQRSCRVRLPGSYQFNLSGTCPGQGSRGCRAAIDRHIHGVLTRWDCRGKSGGASLVRSSRTSLECGSVVVTAVAAMGGRGRATGWDWLIVSAPEAGGILTSVRRASMVNRTSGACWVGGGASLMGVSVSPTVSTRGGSVG